MSSKTDAFCPECGGELASQFIPEEGRERLVCRSCDRIHYLNPSIVAGIIPVANGKVWLLRRGIEPRYGAWTFPAGYMEMGESVEQAAIRETREELNLEVSITGLLGIYSRPTMVTVLAVYTADAISEPSIGHETLSFASFRPDEVEGLDLAFWTTRMALRDWLKTLN